MKKKIKEFITASKFDMIFMTVYNKAVAVLFDSVLTHITMGAISGILKTTNQIMNS